MDQFTELCQYFPSDGSLRSDLCADCTSLGLSELLGQDTGKVCRGRILEPTFQVIQSRAGRCRLCHCIVFAINLSRKKPLPKWRLWLRPVTQPPLNVWFKTSSPLDGFQILSGEFEALNAGLSCPEITPLGRTMTKGRSWEGWSDPQEHIFGYLQCTISGERSKSGILDGLRSHRKDTSQVYDKWIQNCDQAHELCKAAIAKQDDESKPRRLLHISSKEDKLKVKLCDQDLGAARYAALSHCWGVAQVLKTTAASLSLFKKEVPWSALPKTFQDAIKLTRMMGIHYIWIDSLCIIQDDRTDWETESPKMKTVYSGAYVTIAAAAGVSAASGCLPYQAQASDCSALPQTDGSRGTYAHLMPFPARICWWNLNDEPLRTRGWTLQERALSHRLLHCSEFEFVWFCREQSTSCVGTDLALHEHWDMGIENMFVPNTFAAPLYAYQYWCASVLDYSYRAITVPTDKAMALQGLADTLKSFIPGRYVHGTWEFGLQWALSWYLAPHARIEMDEDGDRRDVRPFGFSPEDVSRQRHVPGRAPSWSWLKVDGVINCHIDFKPDSNSDSEEDDLSVESAARFLAACRSKQKVEITFADAVHSSETWGSARALDSVLRVTGDMFEAQLVQGLPEAWSSLPSGAAEHSNVQDWHWKSFDGSVIMNEYTYLAMDDPQFPFPEEASKSFHMMILDSDLWLILASTGDSGLHRRIGVLKQLHFLDELSSDTGDETDDEDAEGARDGKSGEGNRPSSVGARLLQIVNRASRQTIFIC